MKRFMTLFACILVALSIVVPVHAGDDPPIPDTSLTCESGLEAHLEVLYDTIAKYDLWEYFDTSSLIVTGDDEEHSWLHTMDFQMEIGAHGTGPDSSVFHEVADPGEHNCHDYKKIYCKRCTNWVTIPGWPHPTCTNWKKYWCDTHGSHCW